MEARDKQAQLQGMFMEAESYKKQLDSLRNEARMLESTMEEARGTLAAIDALKTNKAGTNIMMPIGSGCFIKAKLAETENIIVGIGAAISMEKTVDDAKKYIEERAETIGGTMEKLQKAAYEVNEKLLELDENSKELMAEMQASQRPKLK